MLEFRIVILFRLETPPCIANGFGLEKISLQCNYTCPMTNKFEAKTVHKLTGLAKA